MRGPQFVLFLLVLSLLAPLAMGAQTLPAALPARGLPLAPQLFCEILYDRAGSQICDVRGSLFTANELRITMLGPGSVYTWADDISGAHARQLTVATCTASCVEKFPVASTTQAGLYIHTTGAAGTSIAVAIDRSPN